MTQHNYHDAAHPAPVSTSGPFHDAPVEQKIAALMAQADALNQGLETLRASLHRSATAVPVTGPAEGDLTVSEAVARVREARVQRHARADDSVTQVSKAAELFIALVGDLPLNAIDEAQAAEFKGRLSCLPRDARRSARYRGRDLREITDAFRAHRRQRRHDHERAETFLAISTINTHLAGMQSLFRELGLRNPFTAVRYKTREMKEDTTSHAEWPKSVQEAFFGSPLYTGCRGATRRAQSGPTVIKDGLYWAPLLARLMGFRVGEAATVPVAAVREMDGVPVVAVGRGGQPVKCPSARRIVPIPQTLIDRGFLEHVQDQRRAGEEMLFPNLQGAASEKAAHHLTKRFRSYAANVIGTGYSLTGLRHTFASEVLRSGAPSELVRRLLGVDQTDTAGFGTGWLDPEAAKRALDEAQRS